MPMAAPRACGTCGVVRCTTHVRKPWIEKVTTTKRIVVGRALQQARATLHALQYGCCKACGTQAPFTTHTWIRDHIIPLAEGGQDIASNTQGLCALCSESKTIEEAKRGMRRHRHP
jgi:5-methylcytosine-specific restriction protein A